MPLFRSHSNGSDNSSRRSELDRHTGCIGGFFQIFDPQVRAKQIAGPPRKEAPIATAAPQTRAPPAESCTSVHKESDFTLVAECGDGKVAVVAKGDARALSEVCIGGGEPQGLGSIQSTSDNNHDSIKPNPSQQEKQLIHRSSEAPGPVREEPAKAGTMMRHSSFKDRDYHDHEIAFSPQRGNVAAFAAGGRRFTSNGSNQENKGMPKEDEKWGCWSSPAENWPSYDSMQEPEHDVVAAGRNSAWLSKGGRVAERYWAAEDSLEEWKQSLRALARLKEDEEAGVFWDNSGLVAPKASPRAFHNELLPTSPARASAFDFKEAIRWSQRTSSHAEISARRSWDDRDLPRSIAELRDAINARSRAISAASPPPSPRPPSVVARLMGLDNLPQEQAPLITTTERKPSGEAKLLQQLLQCSPSPTLPPLPPSSAVRAQQRRTRAKNGMDYPALTSANRDASTQSEFQSMLKHIETMSLHGNSNSGLNAKSLGAMSRYSKPSEYIGAEPLSTQPPSSKKNNHQNYLPVVVLKQSEEIRSLSPRPSRGYHDEIERRLRQLGLQSSEQERKTLKQILEAMQHKGLLKPPDGNKPADGTRRQQAYSLGSPFITSGHITTAHTNTDGPTSSWPSPSVTKPLAHSNVSTPRKAKRDGSASIVIMKPLAKSVNRATANIENHLMVNESAVASSSRPEKICRHKPKSAVKIENRAAKEIGRSRSRLHSSSASKLAPASLHTSGQARKLSLNLRQGQINVTKGSSQAVSVEQAQKNNSASSNVRRRRSREQSVLSKDSAKPVSVIEKEMESGSPDEAIYGDISDLCVSDDIQNTLEQSECVSDGSLSDPSLQETTMEEEIGVVTPPREFKMDRSFGEIDEFFVKDIEQCSPVSVLDTVHLSNNEVVESPDEFEEEECLRDYQVDGKACNPLLEDVRFPSLIVQPVSLETLCEIVVMDSEEAHASNVELSDANELNLLASRKNAHAILKEDDDVVMGHGLDHACSNDDLTAAGGQQSNEASSAGKEHKLVFATCRNDSEKCSDMNGEDQTQVEDAYAIDIAENADACPRVAYDEVSSEDMLFNADGSNAEEMDEPWTSNVDSCYTEDLLRGAGAVVGREEGWCMAEGWLAGGGKMGQEVYEELEKQWDAREEEGGCIEDRDMGGELYRKSQQAAMRRRLLFDCMNEILEARFSWVGIPGTCGGHRLVSVAVVWGDLQRLEEGPYSVEDSMYAMLEQDLLHDADYSISQCWNGKPTQLASVALQLEHDILDSLILEILPHAPDW